ncbi:hypothetical protein SEA_LILBEANIE_94 [Gordonia phage Lilbeanie]|uniref:Uncharacterized protein n=1 Tax=Gordonia phage Lilbeanie TaxID=2794947 RepID=A0A7T1KSF0_9CAUD|nr:hypothetical protein J1773_gp94 [Gordonia phage Lilbeanie]QPO17172.1 hypothetical protein SEA_LILBEANIE_94 [Gordonia phage Lilbeanie]
MIKVETCTIAHNDADEFAETLPLMVNPAGDSDTQVMDSLVYASNYWHGRGISLVWDEIQRHQVTARPLVSVSLTEGIATEEDQALVIVWEEQE